jgi:hypothetical protein
VKVNVNVSVAGKSNGYATTIRPRTSSCAA